MRTLELKNILEMARKSKLKKAKALNNRIKVLIGWGFNIEDANLNSILAWYDGHSYIISKVWQSKRETIDGAVQLNVSEFSVN